MISELERVRSDLPAVPKRLQPGEPSLSIRVQAAVRSFFIEVAMVGGGLASVVGAGWGSYAVAVRWLPTMAFRTLLGPSFALSLLLFYIATTLPEKGIPLLIEMLKLFSAIAACLPLLPILSGGLLLSAPGLLLAWAGYRLWERRGG
jgi:hypothetical protein